MVFVINFYLFGAVIFLFYSDEISFVWRSDFQWTNDCGRPCPFLSSIDRWAGNVAKMSPICALSTLAGQYTILNCMHCGEKSSILKAACTSASKTHCCVHIENFKKYLALLRWLPSVRSPLWTIHYFKCTEAKSLPFLEALYQRCKKQLTWPTRLCYFFHSSWTIHYFQLQ